MRARGDWLFLEEATAAADDLLDVFAPEAIAKGSNPLSRGGFDALVRRLTQQIAKQAAGADARAVREAAKKLDRKWIAMRAAERNAAIKAAADAILKVPPLVIPKITKALLESNSAVIQATKGATATAHDLEISAALKRVDQQIVDHAASSQGSYITDQYGQRASAYEQRARDIVAEGIEAGYDNAAIGERLATALTDPMLRKAASYWESVASIHTARARSYGMLASFEDAGISQYQWSSVLDERTSESCRFLHGRVFDTGGSLERYKQVAEGEADVEDVQPFLRQGRTDAGDSVLFANIADRRVVVARVEEPGFGTKDKVGTYGRAASDAALQKLGITSPPAHPRCRSSLIPA